MSFSLTWLASVLKEAGLKVAEVDGWRDRGKGDVGEIVGVICHHTAGPKTGNMPSLRTLVSGRADLPGPLSQLALGRDGTYYVIAAGRCNHAGKGIWKGFVNGNSNFIGIEAENTGGSDDQPWPTVQMEAYQRGVAAILKHIGRNAEFCAGHKEFALPKGRKPDASFDMNDFRLHVSDILNGITPAATLIPAVEPQASSGKPARRTIRRGDNGDLVRELQTLLKIKVDGDFGAKTEAAMREFQRKHGLVPDGIVGPKSWKALDGVV